MPKTFKQDKGVAGLSILLGVIVTLFIIGLLVTIFAIMGTEMRDSTYTSTTISKTNLTTTYSVNETGVYLTGYDARNRQCTASACINATSKTLIESANYTLNSSCYLKFVGTENNLGSNNSLWNCTYSYVYDADNTATDTMNDTVSGISGVTDWFDIFIVITAMVVLILLVVVIITAIRGSGMMGATSSSGKNSVGTA